MMILLFSVNGDKYGINVRDIAEVLPSVALKHFPNGPEHIAGLLNYRGLAVPVIDLTLLMTAQASRNRISSRIVLIDFHHEDESRQLLGLLIEKITETLRIPDNAFTHSGVITHESPFLGDIAIHNDIMIQIVNVRKILPEPVRSLLFCDNKEKCAIDDGAED